MNTAIDPISLTHGDATYAPSRAAAQFAHLRVAIVHYWFIGRTGGERVVESLADLFPQADLFTLIARPEALSPELKQRKLTTSFLQRLPLVQRFHRHTLLLQPLALEQFDLTEYDLVLSSESGPAKGVLTTPSALHVCYCHSPMRYIWDMYPIYARNMGLATRLLFGLTAHKMRLWDYASAGRVDAFVANSRFVASRVRKFYAREAAVIHPPVEVSTVTQSEQPGDYYLVVGRLVDYKRVDLAIEACKRLGRQLKIIGSGPQYKELKRMAGSYAEFLGSVDDDEKYRTLAGCRALLFPGEEDFGIVPVEAQAHGRPVIAYGAGGVLETVVDLPARPGAHSKPTGVMFQQQSVAALEAAILKFEATAHLFRPDVIRSHAMQFDSSVFRQKMEEFLAIKLASHQTGVLS